MHHLRILRAPLVLIALLAGCAAASGGAEDEAPAPPAEGPAAEAGAHLQELFDRAARISGDEALPPDAKRAQIDHLLEPLLDPSLLARMALGPHAERCDRDQLKYFSYECARFVTTSLRRRSDVTGRARAAVDAPDFPRRIREGLPGRPPARRLAP